MLLPGLDWEYIWLVLKGNCENFKLFILLMVIKIFFESTLVGY